jgi:sec-independent protein translocase protein TatA
MGSLSIWHWLIVLVVVLILFGGGGKLSRLMGDMAKGVNAFKKGLKEDPEDKEEGEGAKASIEADAAAPVQAAPVQAAKKDEAAKG